MPVTRSTLAAIGVAGVLAAGAAIPAIAQDATDDTPTQDTTEDTTREERHAAREAAFAEALAEELGLDTGTVADAIDAVREDLRAARQAEMQERIRARLDELVESGELTQQEADTLADIQERGVFGDGLGPFGPFGRGGPHGLRGGFDAPHDAGSTTDDATADAASA